MSQGPVLGVDLGTVRVGLALGEPGSGLILPLPTLDHPGSDEALVARLAELARARDVAAVVIGLPLHAGGAESSNSRQATRLRELLTAALGEACPVHLQDERWTSAQAETELRELGLRWWQVPKSQVDAMAAMTIVRDWLSERGLLPPEPGQEPPAPAPAPRNEREARRAKLRKRERRPRADEDE